MTSWTSPDNASLPAVGEPGWQVPPPVPPGPRRRSRRTPVLVGGAVVVVALVVVVVVVAKPTSLLPARGERVFTIPSTSMQPTLTVGDRIVVKASVVPQRGDVVTLLHDVGEQKNQLFVKRVVGVGGDSVACPGTDQCSAFVVNGVVEDAGYPAGMVVPSFTVPDGQLFVVGDNRADSYDSRFFGPVPAASVTGTVVAVEPRSGGRHAVPGASKH